MKPQYPAPPAGANFFMPPPGNSLKATLQQAMAMCQRGQATQAERLLRELLARDPEQFDSLQMLALLRLQRKNYAEGLTLLDRAITLRPDLAPMHNNRGVALRGLGKLDEALASYDKAVSLQPDYADAHHNRGNALRELARPLEALESFDRVLALKPTQAQAHNNRGAVLRDVGRHEEALQAFAMALSIKTDYAEALNNQGSAFQDMGRHAEAFAAYSRAMEIQPAFAEAYNNRGSLLEELHRHEEALADYSRAIALAPGFARAHANHGNALSEMHRHEDALESYRRALELEPGSADMLANRAAIFSHLKRHDRASADYEHLLQIAPSHPYALGNLLMSRLHYCDWSGYEEALHKLQAATLAAQPAALPFTLAVTSARADVQLEGARQYVARECTLQNSALWQGERYEHERIRLAYLSADLHDHATAHLMIDLFEQHDRSRFEVTAISFGPDAPSAMRERLKNAFDHFVEARQLGNEDVARLMHEREIDIAIDLKGHTRDSRPGILARRPAPVQVNYLGFPGTMGAPFIDYIIADGTLITDADLAFYSERVVRLSGSYQINSQRAVAEVQAPDRTSAGLPADGFVFCSFNNNYKITPDVFACWMRLLHEVPRGVLWLLEDNAIAAGNLRQTAERSGIDGARLIFAPRAALPEHLARHRLADLFLDTTPCNAHTTASDALWAGLPLLTCRGTTFAGRVAQSLLQAIGLPELVADDLDGYYKKAIQLAGDPSELSRLRSHLQANRGAPPLDSERTRRQLESAYTTMHERVQGGLSPMPFDVAPDICQALITGAHCTSMAQP